MTKTICLATTISAIVVVVGWKSHVIHDPDTETTTTPLSHPIFIQTFKIVKTLAGYCSIARHNRVLTVENSGSPGCDYPSYLLCV